ncbi:glycosyltransferase domain-containing protein [Butyrivibrio sp. VCB2006]|uniref:glycosyltransferase domain-containing protein n=1 Tax=Butyrivibrio sp. VCB2006 TaxID=1280679 RepID=UPI000492B45A|nr:glycosyltransferase domain-containing protein [Butyrivibrio sp. VCB2006]
MISQKGWFMYNPELVSQISELIQHMNSMGFANEDLLINIYNAIYYALFDEQSNSDVDALQEYIREENTDTALFSYLAQKCLTRYCGDKLYEYKESPVSEQIEEKNKQIRALNEHLKYISFVRNAYQRKYSMHSNRFQGRGVVYSVITGGYDFVNEPIVKDSDLDYILVTDKMPDDYKGLWNIKVADNEEELSPRLLSRWLKMHPHILFPEYDYSIYVDGSIRIKDNMETFLDIYSKTSGMLCFPHHSSGTLEDEVQIILDNGKADKNEIMDQLEKYKNEGYVGKGYLIEAGCIVRDHHDQKLQRVMETWWDEYRKYSHGRDQMSFDYACWKNGYDYDICDMLVSLNPWLEATVVH